MPIDYSRYPPDWEQRRIRILERDDYTCQHCEATPDKDEIVLTVAHLDHDETNWDVEDDRLKTLCAGCHLNYDRNDNQSRKAYGKHYRDNQLNLF